MIFVRRALFLLGLIFVSSTAAAAILAVPAGIDPSPWDALLKKYVNEEGLVAYSDWRANAADLQSLDDFILAYARVGGSSAEGTELLAALINAYNAFTVRWILQNYPTESIRDLADSWSQARWNIGGRILSLDEIEHRHLRPHFGWKVHATIVCAARSCPPLQRKAYTMQNVVSLTEDAFRTWLGRSDLNKYDPIARVVRVSPIFKWFKSDFVEDGSLAEVLERFGPSRYRPFFKKQDYTVEYLDYDWGLNDQGDRGHNYRPSLLRRLF